MTDTDQNEAMHNDAAAGPAPTAAPGMKVIYAKGLEPPASMVSGRAPEPGSPAQLGTPMPRRPVPPGAAPRVVNLASEPAMPGAGVAGDKAAPAAPAPSPPPAAALAAEEPAATDNPPGGLAAEEPAATDPPPGGLAAEEPAATDPPPSGLAALAPQP